jgi:hypothetical protein
LFFFVLKRFADPKQGQKELKYCYYVYGEFNNAFKMQSSEQCKAQKLHPLRQLFCKDPALKKRLERVIVYALLPAPEPTPL